MYMKINLDTPFMHSRINSETLYCLEYSTFYLELCGVNYVEDIQFGYKIEQIQKQTRHFSRMRTNRLPTDCGSNLNMLGGRAKREVPVW